MMSTSFVLLVLCNIISISFSRALIDKVHIIWCNHLDVGYHRGWDIDSCAWNEACTIHSVIDEYWHYYFPLTISIADRLQNEFNFTFNYLTFPYLMSLYLDCQENNEFNLKCPTEEAKLDTLNGVKNGYLWFNAFPFNCQLENYDKSLLEFGINLSYDLMKNLTDLPSKYYSTVISQRDVPGIPRNSIPVLTKNGIRAYSVGANNGNTPLNASKIFKWIDPNSKEMIFVMFHNKGYGGFKISDALIIDGFNQALIYAWNSDNLGPFLEPEIFGILEGLKTEFDIYNGGKVSNIQLLSSTFDIFLDELLSFPNKSVVENIPIYDGEIGDRWSFGIPSDPYKTAAYRNAMKLRSNCLKRNECSLDSPYFYNFSRLLLKNGEHTWGASVKKSLDFAQNAPDSSTYYNEPFWASLASNNSMNNFTQMRQTWYEQRDYGLNFALDALSYSDDVNDITLYHDILNVWNGRLHNVSSPNVDTNEWIQINQTNSTFSFCDAQYILQFNDTSGAISYLYNKQTQIQYANGATDNNLGQFWYQALNQSLKGTNGHIELPNIYVTTNLLNIYQNVQNENKFVIEMNFGDTKMYNNLCANYSCIYKVYNELSFDCENNKIEMDLKIINKTFTRIPETIYFGFVPYKCNNWTIDSFGEPVQLNNIIGGGSYNIYAYGIDGNVTCQFMQNNMNNNISYSLDVDCIDIALTSFKPIKYPNEMAQGYWTWENGFFVNSSQNDGFAFELMNNMWGTNYPQWYPFDAKDENITFNVNIYL